MGVEQDGLGFLVNFRKFYQVEAGRFSQGDPRRLQVGAACGQAHGLTEISRFVAMKLQKGPGHCGAGLADALGRVVYKQQDGRDKGGQQAGQFDGAFDAHVARAGRVKHKAHGVGASLYGGLNIGFAGEAAHLDAGALLDHGSQSKGGVVSGSPHCAS